VLNWSGWQTYIAEREQQSASKQTDASSVLDWSLASCQLDVPGRGVLRFGDVARDYQKDLLSNPADRLLIVKGRQLGISQTLAMRAAYEAAVKRGTCLVVSRSGEQAALFLRYVYAALRGVPGITFTTENQSSLELAGGGQVVTQAASKRAGRGIPATLLLLDEFAWAEEAEAIYIATMPTLSETHGSAIIASTPNGRANKFYQLAAGDPRWTRVDLPWSVHPERDEAWRDATIDDIGREAFAQEHGIDFAVSGGAVFDPADIAAAFCLTGTVGPQAHHRYLTAWDLGRKQDATVGVTWDTTSRPYRVVAYERMLHASYPDQQAAIEDRHRQYPGHTIVESNGVGDPVIQNLKVKVDEFMTTPRTKKDAIDALQLLLQRRAMQLPPWEQAERELGLYQRDDRMLVQDCVLALAIGASKLLAVPTGAPAVLAQGTARGW
jgi:hypothetical protein